MIIIIIIIIIFLLFFFWGGMGGVILTVCLFFFSDAGINVCFELMNELIVALFWIVKQHFLHVSEK